MQVQIPVRELRSHMQVARWRPKIKNFKNIFFKASIRDFPGGSVVRNLPSNTEDMGSIPGLRSQDGTTEPAYHN